MSTNLAAQDKMKKSNSITVQFTLRKGYGAWPTVEELSIEETKDLTIIGKFFLDWEEQQDGISEELIDDIEVIYDGITYLEKIKLGLQVLNGKIEGHPSPVLKFNFRKQVCEEIFIKTIWNSFMLLTPKKRDSEEGFCCEDHQGYTKSLDKDSLHHLINTVRHNTGLSYGKITFDELQTGAELCKFKSN